MRIAIVSQGVDSVLPPVQTSVGVCSYGLATHLAPEHHVTVFFRAPDGRARSGTDATGVELAGLARSPLDDLLARAHPRLVRVLARVPGLRRLKPYSTSLLCHPSYALRASLALRRIRPDVIHVQQSLQFAPLYRAFNRRSVVVVHKHSLWDPASGRSATRRQLKSVDGLLCVSDYIAADFRHHFPRYGGRIETVADGVEGANGFAGPTCSERPTVLFVGHLSPHKGVHDAIAAFVAIADRHPDVVLEVVGPDGAYALDEVARRGDRETSRLLRPFYTAGGAELSTYEASERYSALLRDSVPPHLRERVSFRGRMPHAEVRALMSGAEVLVFPSLCEEGFGMPPVEAMMCATPVVTTRAGAIAETVADGRTGYVVERADVDGLSRGLEQLLSDPDRRVRMGQAARAEAVRRFAWPVVAGRAVEVYAALLGTHRPRRGRARGVPLGR